MVQKTSIPPFVFASSVPSERRQINAWKKAKAIRLVGPRLYTSLPKSQVQAAVRELWSEIVSALFPGALLSYRSALEFKPDPDGVVYLTASTYRKIQYPGLTIQFVRGGAPLKDDAFFLSLRASSLPRALLENLSISRKNSSRRLSEEDIEKRVEEILKARGETELNRLRDRAREISKQLGWKAAFKKLDALVGGILGTRKEKSLRSPSALARAQGRPYDSSCLSRLTALVGDLRNHPFPERVERRSSASHFTHKAFFDAYFSNFIEGTTFEIEEAEQIVFDRKIPARRPEDAHDISGTFEIVSNSNEMKRTPESPTDFFDLLRARHALLMEGRSEVKPGKFKDAPNRAGNTHFVRPDEVEGTLERGLELCANLPAGMPKAIFMMALITEVHPFLDGNGRIARIFMNAELTSAELCTLIVPNVYREDYLLALRALSRRERSRPLIDALTLLHKACDLDFSEYARALKELRRRNWFEEPGDARLSI